MQRGRLDMLLAFVAVAREGSFTRAAAQLGISQSTLSHTVRDLEERLGIRLLTRTTRSVSPTEAGERLLRNIGPRFEEIEAEVEALSELREKPAGTIRLTASDHAFNAVIWPKLAKLLPDYPDVTVEAFLDNALTDIAAERFDAGVRMGERVAKDMIAVRVGPDIRFAVVGTNQELGSKLRERNRRRAPPTNTRAGSARSRGRRCDFDRGGDHRPPHCVESATVRPNRTGWLARGRCALAGPGWHA